MTPPLDQKSWHEELLKHLDWLRSVVQSRLRESEFVEDVVNDVIADALALSNPHATVAKPAPWLYRLAIRKVLLFRRKLGRRRRAYQACRELNPTPNSNGQQTPLESLLGRERQHAVRIALSQLSGKDVEILLLKYVHEWNYEAISENLGIDYWKVVHRLRQARNRLRGKLLQSLHSQDPK